VLPAAPRWKTLPMMSGDPGEVGDTITVTPGTWSGPAVSTDTVTMMRCTRACVAVGTANAASYLITSADVGAILRVQETASNAGGSTVVWTTRYVGPVTSVAAGFAVVGIKGATVLNADGAPLAVAQIDPTSVAAEASAASVAGVAAVAARTVKLRRAPGVRGALHAWACPLVVPTASRPLPCTAAVVVHEKATLRLPESMVGKVRVVVVRGKRA